MRLKKLTSGVALLGLSTGLGLTALAATATTASAATVTIRPYLFNVAAIGGTDSGVWDNEACLIQPDGDNPGDNGKINGVVVAGHSGQLNIKINQLSDGAPVSTCVPIDIHVTGTDSVTPGTKPGGTLNVTTTSDVQGGILATSVTSIDVTYAAGQSIKAPSGSTIVSGTVNNPAGDTVRLSLKGVGVKTKYVSSGSCHDVIKVVDTSTTDAGGAPIATDWDNTTHPALTASQYMATMRECAADPSNIPGKALVTKISVIGDGAVSASFVKAFTVNPETWDTTAGSSCGAAKGAATGPSFGGTAILESRVILCKGAYSAAGIPPNFALDVRGWTTNGGEDPWGLNHPLAPVSLGSGSFSN